MVSKYEYINSIITLINLKNHIISIKNPLEDLIKTANLDYIVDKDDPLHIEKLGKNYDKLQKKIQHKYIIYQFTKLGIISKYKHQGLLLVT
jgi:hypothetical protein